MLEALVQWFLDATTFWLVSILKQIATVIWMVQRAIGATANLITTSDFWSGGLEMLLDELSEGLPSAYTNILLGNSGLMYLGLIMAGTFLLLPQFVVRRRPVELDRVIYWAMFVSMLFISSSAGFNFIRGLEMARLNMSQSVRTNTVPGGSMAGIVTGMVGATEAEVTDVSIFEWSLPNFMETTFFEYEGTIDEIEIVYYDIDLLGVLQTTKIDVLTVDTPESRIERINMAMEGLWRVVFNIVPTALALIILGIFVLLAVQAVMCIIYFLFVLPVGMFEFGTNMLAEIAQRYLMIWIISILVGVLPSIMISINDVLFFDDGFEVTDLVSDMVIYLFTTIVICLVMLQLAKTVNNMVGDTYKVFGEAINAGIRPHAGNTELAGFPTPVRDAINEAQQSVSNVASLAAGAAAVYFTGDPRAGMAAANVTQQVTAPKNENGQPKRSAVMNVFNEGAVLAGQSSSMRTTRSDRYIADMQGARGRLKEAKAREQRERENEAKERNRAQSPGLIRVGRHVENGSTPPEPPLPPLPEDAQSYLYDDSSLPVPLTVLGSIPPEPPSPPLPEDGQSYLYDDSSELDNELPLPMPLPDTQDIPSEPPSPPARLNDGYKVAQNHQKTQEEIDRDLERYIENFEMKRVKRPRRRANDPITRDYLMSGYMDMSDVDDHMTGDEQ